VHKKGSYLR